MPTMVDVQDKSRTVRHARARAVVRLPPAVMDGLAATDVLATDYNSAKGPVFCTAIIAGTMAVKRTSELVPFCHPLPIEKCDVHIRMEAGNRVVIECAVSVEHKTGVEMEALVGANVAALTVYDMCKALSHDIVIEETRLLHKSGGKRKFDFEDGKQSSDNDMQ